jgi:hypothetical protein
MARHSRADMARELNMRRLFAALAILLGLGAMAPASAQNRFYVVNNSGQQINEIYVSSSRVQQWGPDILGDSVLPAGNQVWVTPTFSDCVLDVRVVYVGGREENRMGVNACSISRVTFGGGGVVQAPGAGSGAVIGGGPGARVNQGNPSFVFINQTGTVIREIYASMSTQNGWGQDRLGANTLAPGGQINIGLPMGLGCNTDVRVVFMNGAAQERRGLETCSVTALNWR